MLPGRSSEIENSNAYWRTTSFKHNIIWNTVQYQNAVQTSVEKNGWKADGKTGSDRAHTSVVAVIIIIISVPVGYHYCRYRGRCGIDPPPPGRGNMVGARVARGDRNWARRNGRPAVGGVAVATVTAAMAARGRRRWTGGCQNAEGKAGADSRRRRRRYCRRLTRTRSTGGGTELAAADRRRVRQIPPRPRVRGCDAIRTRFLPYRFPPPTLASALFFRRRKIRTADIAVGGDTRRPSMFQCCRFAKNSKLIYSRNVFYFILRFHAWQK